MGLDELGQEPLTTSMLACAGCGKDLSDKESDPGTSINHKQPELCKVGGAY